MANPNESREFASFADDAARNTLDRLLSSVGSPSEYRSAMTELGLQLGRIVAGKIPCARKCLVVSTAEDADYLSKGVIESLCRDHEALAAVFWNNHYSISNGSIAPVVHRYLQQGFESAEYLIVVKSIISTSCVVKTNLLSLIEKIHVKKIYVVAPVMYITAEESLCSEFPKQISDLFEFVYFAIDAFREETGEVRPGIGGQIYELLGIRDQPARTGFLPQLVRNLMSM
jgi:hypothetical protein